MSTNRTSEAVEEFVELIQEYKYALESNGLKRETIHSIANPLGPLLFDMLSYGFSIAQKYRRMEEALQKLTTTEPQGYYYSCETVDEIVREALAFDPLAPNCICGYDAATGYRMDIVCPVHDRHLSDAGA